MIGGSNSPYHLAPAIFFSRYFQPRKSSAVEQLVRQAAEASAAKRRKTPAHAASRQKAWSTDPQVVPVPFPAGRITGRSPGRHGPALFGGKRIERPVLSRRSVRTVGSHGTLPHGRGSDRGQANAWDSPRWTKLRFPVIVQASAISILRVSLLSRGEGRRGRRPHSAPRNSGTVSGSSGLVLLG
jgi:hypothetical protein